MAQNLHPTLGNLRRETCFELKANLEYRVKLWLKKAKRSWAWCTCLYSQQHSGERITVFQATQGTWFLDSPWPWIPRVRVSLSWPVLSLLKEFGFCFVCFNCTKFYQNFKCQISFCFYYGKVWPDFSKKLECEIWIMFLHDYEIILLIQCSALLCSLLFIFFSFLFYCSWLSC